MIPFSPPRIDQKIIDEVTAALQSGWITTGPRTKRLEKELSEYVGVSHSMATNSATAGLELILRWFGVGPGDEVIVPAYTYTATGNVVLHCGATVVFCDAGSDFNLDVGKLSSLITENTKVIMPVDFSGFPCDYNAIIDLVNYKAVREQFRPKSAEQKQLGRVLVLADAAHSLGAQYEGKRSGALADVSVFSFHAVKNLVTAEGGAICLNLPEPFDNEAIYKHLCIFGLHGQSKDALAKTEKGAWEYDVEVAGYKTNMPDILAAIGLVELARYETETLPKRRKIFEAYNTKFKHFAWCELPPMETDNSRTCFHLYPLRIKGITEDQRNNIIKSIFNQDVSVNVHFKPLPLLTLYKRLGYNISDYPVAFDNYSREISLPVYFDLSDEQIEIITQAVITAVSEELG